MSVLSRLKVTRYQCTECGDASLVEFRPGIKPYPTIPCPNCGGKMVLVNTD